MSDMLGELWEEIYSQTQEGSDEISQIKYEQIIKQFKISSTAGKETVFGNTTEEFYQKLLGDVNKENIQTGREELLTEQLLAAGNFVSEQETIKQQLCTSIIETKKLTLVLGAGCSNDCGLPAWKELLGRLYIKLDENNLEREAINSFIKIPDFTETPLIAAKYLCVEYGKNKENPKKAFYEAIYDQLYQSSEEKESELLNEILKLSTMTKDKKFLQDIITFNFDNLLERKSKKLVPISYHSPHDTSEENIRVYHVHGLLEKDEKERINGEEGLIFSEEDYHDQYNKCYGWGNLTQLDRYRSNTCLFIGVSLTDPNMRRLLEIAKKHYTHKEQTPHYVIRRELSKDKLPSISIKEFDLLVLLHRKFFTEANKALGIQTIWVKTRDDIPRELDNVRVVVMEGGSVKEENDGFYVT